MLTTTHAERSKPTLKDAERFRNGLFCCSRKFQLYVERKNLLITLQMNSLNYLKKLNNLNTISIQSNQFSLVSLENCPIILSTSCLANSTKNGDEKTGKHTPYVHVHVGLGCHVHHGGSQQRPLCIVFRILCIVIVIIVLLVLYVIANLNLTQL